MDEMQATEASRFLLGLAQRNARVYISHLNAQAIIVTGSVAEGLSDFYSDLDLIVYYDKLPSEEELLMAARQNQGQERRLLGSHSEEEAMETYQVGGVECQLGHITIATWERDMATVLEQLDVASPLQKALGGMLDALPLYGELLIRQWQAKLAAYPDALAQAMVRHHLAFFPLWGIQERMAVRDATIWMYQLLAETANNLLGVLAGLNRRYFSSFQFKRTQRFIAQLELVPPRLADRLEAAFHADLAVAVQIIEELVRETIALVEHHMPQIDTARIRQQLDWRQQPWSR
jgi:predicted nucleotidyltransferase